MPLYDYSCPACGVFEKWQPAARAGDPVACPGCGAEARRRYTPPNVVRTPVPVARAIERSERSAYEPRVVTRQPGSGSRSRRSGWS